jgi:alkanesulfonate monooxygenase SsuD/methylene tetrahydromethanopterin reductase-like flavin-dependent oxidoreductase (luciferase family)
VLTRLGLRLPVLTASEPQEPEAFTRLASLAEAAELSGFDSIWVADRPGAGPEALFEAYTLLGALATCTRTTRLGALVSSVTSRNPGALVKQVTTLDVLSSGRAVLGVGANENGVEHGANPGTTQEQLGRLGEALQIFRALLDKGTEGDQPSFEGRYYQLKSAPNRPRPVQESGLPVLVGCRDGQPLKLVAQYADACSLSGDLTKVRREVSILDRYLEAVEREPSTVAKILSLSVDGFVAAGERPAAIAEYVAGFLDAGIDGIIVKLPGNGDGRLDDVEIVAELGRALS